METEISPQPSGEKRQEPPQPIRVLERETDGGISSHLQRESFYSTPGLFYLPRSFVRHALACELCVFPGPILTSRIVL